MRPMRKAVYSPGDRRYSLPRDRHGNLSSDAFVD